MSFFKKKNVLPITVGSTVMSNTLYMANFINALCDESDFNQKMIQDIWSVIYASARRCLVNQPEIEYLDDFLRLKIEHPRLLEEFNSNLRNPQEILFIDLIDRSADLISAIASDLTSEVLALVLSSKTKVNKEVITDTMGPILRFHLGYHLGDLGIEEEYLAAILSGGYSMIVSNAVNESEKFGADGIRLVTKVANTIVALSVTLFIVRRLNKIPNQ